MASHVDALTTDCNRIMIFSVFIFDRLTYLKLFMRRDTGRTAIRGLVAVPDPLSMILQILSDMLLLHDR